MDEIIRAFIDWEKTGKMTLKTANLVMENFDTFTEKQFKLISELTTKKDIEKAYAALISTTNFINAAASKVPGLTNKLQSVIKQYQGHLHNLAQKLGANSISISSGFPSGVTVTVSWNV
jgi:hypothetical protein